MITAEELAKFPDTFNGGDAHLVRSIEALLSLDAKNALVPHGIGGHARGLLSAAMHRLAGQSRAAGVQPPKDAGAVPLPAKMPAAMYQGSTDVVLYADAIRYGDSREAAATCKTCDEWREASWENAGKLVSAEARIHELEAAGRADAVPALDSVLRERGLPTVADALGYSRNYAEATPHLTQTGKDHILSLCNMLEIAAQHPPAEPAARAQVVVGEADIFEAYKSWPEDIRKKLSAHDLRRMGGWAPKTAVADWRIDTSAGGPILVYQNCSVIEGETARYVLRLIERDLADPVGGKEVGTIGHGLTEREECNVVVWEISELLPFGTKLYAHPSPAHAGAGAEALERIANLTCSSFRGVIGDPSKTTWTFSRAALETFARRLAGGDHA